MTKNRSFEDYIGNDVIVELDPKKAKNYLRQQGYGLYVPSVEGVLEDTDDNGIFLNRIKNMRDYEMEIAKTSNYEEAKDVRAKHLYATFIPWGTIVAIYEE
jgi:hypothetical protein